MPRKNVCLNGQLSISTDKEKRTLLPEAYPKAAKAVAEQQVELASNRLANLLGAVL